MADFIADLAGKSGVSPDQAKQAMGTLLSSLKEQLPAESAAKLEKAVPDADRLMTEAKAAPAPAVGGLAEAVGKLTGGQAGGAQALLTKLSALGLSAEQLKTFLPNALAFLKDKLPPDVMNKVSALIPNVGGKA